ncbi:MAG: putative glycoside hydrolase, partial [Bacteroidota bacterium]
HVVALTRESYNLGFDELNYDYVRYPSDGPMSDISFTHSAGSPHGDDKQANLEAFFSYLHEHVSDPALYTDVRHENIGRDEAVPYTPADLFGMTTTNYDDLSIGQIQERAMPYFNFIAPMVYPSHYPDGSFGYPDPNLVPYQIVNYAMQSGVDRAQSSTTRLAGFLHEPIYVTNASGTKVATGEFKKPVFGADNFRTWIQGFDYGGDYDAADVRAQMQASYDAGVDSWMIWSPSNRYTRGGLLPASE